MNRKRWGHLGVMLGLALLCSAVMLVIQGQRALPSPVFARDLQTLRQVAAPEAAGRLHVTPAEPEQHRILLGQVLMPVPTPTPEPQPTPDGTRREVQIPILMYHYVDPPGPHADAIRRDLSVPPEMFEAHLARIQAMGYQTITLKKVVQHLAVGSPLPDQPIVLTFDDGHVDHYTQVFPRLQARGMVGTFFVVSHFPHSGNIAYMTWDMIRDMQAWGMEIEAHGLAHTSLQGRSDAYLRQEARGIIRRFEQELGIRPHIISYPLGHYDTNTMRVFHDEGYWAGITTRSGVLHRSDDMFRIHRVRIQGHMNADQVEWLLSDEGLSQLRRYQ